MDDLSDIPTNTEVPVNCIKYYLIIHRLIMLSININVPYDRILLRCQSILLWLTHQYGSGGHSHYYGWTKMSPYEYYIPHPHCVHTSIKLFLNIFIWNFIDKYAEPSHAFYLFKNIIIFLNGWAPFMQSITICFIVI